MNSDIKLIEYFSMKKWFVAITICTLIAVPAWAQETLTLGIFAYRPKPIMEAAYQPLAEYLDQRLPDASIRLRILSQEEMELALQQGELDLVFTNPSHFMLLRKQNKLTGAIATLVRFEKHQPVDSLGGVIITSSKQTKINTLSDIRGHVLAVPGLKFLGGYQAQAYEILQANISVSKDMAAVDVVGSHDEVVNKVIAGKTDIGFIRTSIIESMVSEGKIALADVKIINPQSHPGFPFLVSTQLYPEWAFAALPNVNKKWVKKLTVALLEIEPDSKVARAAGIHGFTVPGDYLPVENLARALRLPPFETAPAFTTGDVWSRWRLELSVAVGALLIILSLSTLLLLAYRRIKQQEKTGRMQLAALGEGVFGIDLHGKCTFINPAALSMLGYREEEVIGQNPHQLFHHHHQNGDAYAEQDCPVYRTLQDGLVRTLDDCLISKDGRTFPISLVATQLVNDKGRIGAEVAFQDISERKNLEEKLNTLATTDMLTGLPNRRHFFARLEEEQARMRRLDTYEASLMMLDLDHFKQINDRHGHAAGDAVLRHFAEFTQRDLREIDLAGRLGGEEFAILMPGASLQDGLVRAERLRKLIEEEHVNYEDKHIQYTVSIGVTQLTSQDADPDSSLSRADAALYRAKEKRNCVAI